MAGLLQHGLYGGQSVAGEAEGGAEELGGAFALVGRLSLQKDLLAARTGHPHRTERA